MTLLLFLYVVLLVKSFNDLFVDEYSNRLVAWYVSSLRRLGLPFWFYTQGPMYVYSTFKILPSSLICAQFRTDIDFN